MDGRMKYIVVWYMMWTTCAINLLLLVPTYLVILQLVRRRRCRFMDLELVRRKLFRFHFIAINSNGRGWDLYYINPKYSLNNIHIVLPIIPNLAAFIISPHFCTSDVS